jgi:hypothetical protein
MIFVLLPIAHKILKTWQFNWQPGNAIRISLFGSTATSTAQCSDPKIRDGRGGQSHAAEKEMDAPRISSARRLTRRLPMIATRKVELIVVASVATKTSYADPNARQDKGP